MICPWTDGHWLEKSWESTRNLGMTISWVPFAGKGRPRHCSQRRKRRETGPLFNFKKSHRSNFPSGKLHSPHNSANHHFAGFFRLVLPHSTIFTAPRFGSKNSSLPPCSILSDVHIIMYFRKFSLLVPTRPLPVHRRCLLPPCLAYACATLLPCRIFQQISS